MTATPCSSLPLSPPHLWLPLRAAQLLIQERVLWPRDIHAWVAVVGSWGATDPWPCSFAKHSRSLMAPSRLTSHLGPPISTLLTAVWKGRWSSKCSGWMCACFKVWGLCHPWEQTLREGISKGQGIRGISQDLSPMSPNSSPGSKCVLVHAHVQLPPLAAHWPPQLSPHTFLC